MSYFERKRSLILDRNIRAGAILIGTLIAFALSSFLPAPAIAEAAPAGHSVRGEIRSDDERGAVIVDLEIVDPSGAVVAAPRLSSLMGEPIRLNSFDVEGPSGERFSYAAEVTFTEAGGEVTMRVYQAGELVETIATLIPFSADAGLPKRVTLSVESQEVGSFLDHFARLAGISIEREPDVGGTITVSVINQPWPVALTAALRPRNLAFRTVGPESVVVHALPALPPGYHRVGPGIDPPKVLTRVDPIYPAEAKAARIQGVVIVEATISPTGAVESARVIKGLPLGLDEAALLAVRQWTFQPAMKDGQPVGVVYSLVTNFKLVE